PYARERFGHFDFGGITVRNADKTFDRDLTIDVGGRQINLLNLGPAHTAPDGIRAVRGYLVHVAEQAQAAYRKGLSWAEAADTIDLGEYATWLDAERVVVNVYQRYRELDPDMPQQEVMALLVMQADWLAKRSS